MVSTLDSINVPQVFPKLLPLSYYSVPTEGAVGTTLENYGVYRWYDKKIEDSELDRLFPMADFTERRMSNYTLHKTYNNITDIWEKKVLINALISLCNITVQHIVTADHDFVRVNSFTLFSQYVYPQLAWLGTDIPVPLTVKKK